MLKLVINRYDISNYHKVNPIFGTMEDVERLIRETHRRDLKIILDIALNHTASTVSIKSADGRHICHQLITP